MEPQMDDDEWIEKAQEAIEAINDFEIDLALIRLKLALRALNPNEPRVPAGSPEGGQWTSGRASISGRLVAEGDDSEERERICEEQYAKDTFHRRMAGLSACHESAAFRYADCLAGQPIRPLSY
jgi:hypothetical protein